MMFPVYRKYSNGSSLFKIESEVRFIELKRIGKKYQRFEFEAKIFPDRQLITDMLAMLNNHWVESTEDEFNRIPLQP